MNIEHGFSTPFFRFDEPKLPLKGDAHLRLACPRHPGYLNASRFIIDGVDLEPMTHEKASLLFRLVTHRYDRGSIFLTTNKAIRDWAELLAVDEALTAVLGRGA